MRFLLNLAKYGLSLFLITGLLFSSGVFTILLYAKLTGYELMPETSPIIEASAAEQQLAGTEQPSGDETDAPVLAKPEKPASAMIDAPLVKQLPELPAGCEIVSLTMLLQYYGIEKDKMELYEEMVKDPTPIRWSGGKIVYWGNPFTGYVGDATGKSRGYSIYHSALFPTLQSYVPTAVDLTGKDFDEIERKIAEGAPVVIWTTINFQEPTRWQEWDTPIGPIRATFQVHAVLLVGYDEEHVYVNDPYGGKKGLKLNKETFLKTWEALGKQALSYDNV